MDLTQPAEFLEIAEALLTSDPSDLLHYEEIVQAIVLPFSNHDRSTDFRKAERKLSSASSESREQPIPTLLQIYNKLMPDADAAYHLCEINTMFCEHGEQRAKAELKAAEIDWKFQDLLAIARAVEIGRWNSVNMELFAAFRHLVNRVAEALPVRNIGSLTSKVDFLVS